ncbi:hypothetical protein KsCSTR_18400 [Candidatus Kuenenia stuttgartiensis]|uniref:Uncharacterized protein n=1 Tax=Kuenenia stuttgartiensis TaxID=174633 RepID=A0A6G7GPI8_KUEST|nr:hypothetical protein [Candidatus Kuenenia stuttgartiensis]QII11219.1 hypothetical protein KsCSTR_18400 [Candidatus Kuenenia stuttgartiensis]
MGENRYTIRGMLEEKKEEMQALLTKMDNCVKDMLYLLKLNDRQYMNDITKILNHAERLEIMNCEKKELAGQIVILQDKLES